MNDRQEFDYDAYHRACDLLGHWLPSFGHGPLVFVSDHRRTLDRCWEQNYSASQTGEEVAREVNAMTGAQLRAMREGRVNP